MYEALGLARRNTRCRQRALGAYLAEVGLLNIYDIVLHIMSLHTDKKMTCA